MAHKSDSPQFRKLFKIIFEFIKFYTALILVSPLIAVFARQTMYLHNFCSFLQKSIQTHGNSGRNIWSRFLR